MIISDLSDDAVRSFFDGRNFAVIKIEQRFIDNAVKNDSFLKVFVIKNNIKMIIVNSILTVGEDLFRDFVLKIDDGSGPLTGTYLHIDLFHSKEREYLKSFKPTAGISVTYPSLDELTSLVRGKRLIFSTEFEDCDRIKS